MPAKKTFGQRVVHNLGKKWFQVMLSVVAFGLLVSGAQRAFRPATGKESAGGGAKAAADNPKGFKFVHCDSCKLELPYSAEQDGARCSKCQPPKVGYFQPTVTSIKAGGDKNQWRNYNIAVMVLALVWLGAVYYFLSRPVPEPPTAFVISCLHCGMMLRYKRDGVEHYAICPGCEQLIKLPDEDEALTAEDQEHIKEASVISVLEENLRNSGHIIDLDANPDGADAPPADPPSKAV